MAMEKNTKNTSTTVYYCSSDNFYDDKLYLFRSLLYPEKSYNKMVIEPGYSDLKTLECPYSLLFSEVL